MTGTQFRETRNKLLLTQRELAILLGISVKTVSRVENSSRAVEKERALAVLALEFIRENQHAKKHAKENNVEIETAKEKEPSEDRKQREAMQAAINYLVKKADSHKEQSEDRDANIDI